MKLVMFTLFMIFSHTFASDLLDTISDLESKKRDLSILKSEISSNLEFAHTYLDKSFDPKNVKNETELIKKQQALLDSFSALEEKLDLIELKAKFLDLKDMSLEIEIFNSRKLKIQKLTTNPTNSKNLNRYFEFYHKDRFEQAIILKSSLKYDELTITQVYEEEIDIYNSEKMNHEEREIRFIHTRQIVDKEITGFYSVFESLYRLHKLSQTLHQNFTRDNK